MKLTKEKLKEIIKEEISLFKRFGPRKPRHLKPKKSRRHARRLQESDEPGTGGFVSQTKYEKMAPQQAYYSYENFLKKAEEAYARGDLAATKHNTELALSALNQMAHLRGEYAQRRGQEVDPLDYGDALGDTTDADRAGWSPGVREGLRRRHRHQKK